ncbi:MAG: hypothetical protein R2798_10525 [Chitinophagales bacterium]
MVGANLTKCVEALLYAKDKNVEITFDEICMADLTKKDIFKSIDFVSKNLIIEITRDDLSDAKLRRLAVNYIGEFKVPFTTALFDPPDKNQIEKDILPRISKYFEISDVDDLIQANRIITEIILDTTFWESKRLALVGQVLTIRKT